MMGSRGETPLDVRLQVLMALLAPSSPAVKELLGILTDPPMAQQLDQVVAGYREITRRSAELDERERALKAREDKIRAALVRFAEAA
jgi:hypothetical protein